MKRFVFIVLVLVLIFFNCENNTSGTDGNGFIPSSNETVYNDVPTLGLTGTVAYSNNLNVATAEVVAGRIKITSVSAGSAIITVFDYIGNSAEINITVSKTGNISIANIEKYSEQGGNADFTSSRNESVSNNVSDLGLVGINVFSSNINVATAEITSGKIRIISIAEGSVTIIVSNTAGNTASINIRVSKTGTISIISIIKHSTQSGNGDHFSGNNISVFAYDNDVISPFSYSGNLALKAYDYDGGYGLFEVEDYDEDWYIIPVNMPISISNNKLSFEFNNIQDEKLGTLRQEFYSNPGNVKGRIVSSFYYYKWNKEWNGEQYLRLTNKNNFNEEVAYIFVNSDVTITGIHWLYWELSLKKGWNTVKFDHDRLTVTNFTPDSNYIWIFNADVYGNKIRKDMPIQIERDNVKKISGTINVTVDGIFPAGGFSLEAYKSYMSFDVNPLHSPINNPVSWEFDFNPSQSRRDSVSFLLKIYPNEDRQTVFVYNNTGIEYGRPQGNYSNEIEECISYDPQYCYDHLQTCFRYELYDVELNSVHIKTITVPVTLNGFDSGTTLYADDYYGGRNCSIQISGNGNHQFKLPKDIGLNYKNENWICFFVEYPQRRITKGRLNASSTITLNYTGMYPFQ